MLSTTQAIVLSGVALATLLIVHEFGHYAVAALAGVPPSDRRIVWFAIPPHVALADGREWVSPFQNDRFSSAYGRYDPERRYGRLFTAGGLLSQTGWVVLAAGALGATGLAPAVARAVAATSLGFVGCYLAWDLLATARRGRPFGDNTHLWRLSPAYAVGTLSLVVGCHLVVLWWL